MTGRMGGRDKWRPKDVDMIKMERLIICYGTTLK